MDVVNFIIFCESTLRPLDLKALIILTDDIIQPGLQITGEAADRGKQHIGVVCQELWNYLWFFFLKMCAPCLQWK